ncbi:MAG: RNA methyltransferase [Treponema sp.]|jgi:16S rRNA (uracil1498-N3)-methyltransferase|nr:RNA methyltransferase [Treponema sp.]
MRQFVAPELPDAKGRVPVRGKDYAYLRQTLRLSGGNVIDVRLPDGRLLPMTLRFAGAGRTQSAVLEPGNSILDGAAQTGGLAAEQVERGFYRDTTFYLFQFLPKIQKFDTILRQAVETGVTAVVPITGEYSPPQGDFTARRERFRRIVREARQQCGSPVETELLDPVPVEEAADWWKQNRTEPSLGIILSEYAAKDTAALHGRVKTLPCSAAAAVGSEGGVSPAERVCLIQAGFAPVHFPVNVLRVETAALYGIAALESVIMEYASWHVNE